LFSTADSESQDDKMKCHGSVSVFVFAVLALQLTSAAQESTVTTATTPVPSLPDDQNVVYHESGSGAPVSNNSLEKFAQKRTGDARLPDGAFNGYAHIRATPDLGAPGSAGNGFNHFPLPMDRYTNWYRPRAATLTQNQRCAPDSFRPRGMGHLFNRPCDSFRMEYEPYALSDGMSKYGPSYFPRAADPRCPDCDHSVDECENCEKCRKCRK